MTGIRDKVEDKGRGKDSIKTKYCRGKGWDRIKLDIRLRKGLARA